MPWRSSGSRSGYTVNSPRNTAWLLACASRTPWRYFWYARSLFLCKTLMILSMTSSSPGGATAISSRYRR
ncbi:Uncharacterised protein [Mycobacteroides abscessus subsp. abscessus]|nr:Uncharacterised protein [Mycobacteroides abscessus subsp. abscessus]